MRQSPRPFDELRTGFSLHARVRCATEDKQGLERLCRHITRPAITDERLSVNRAGQVVPKLKTAWRDGTSHHVMAPMARRIRHFPTDMQAQFAAMNCMVDGVGVIKETIFENRFMHMNELMHLGADIQIDGHTTIIRGVETLTGAPIIATDLHASA